jgi:ArsR family transcriptional regulator, lead/cadmium/zinc/bismuth-responsive transcriptional repressor
MIEQQTRDPINPVAMEQARRGLPDDDVVRFVAEMFTALGDPTRVRLLYALRQGELCVRDLALAVGISESAASHQLRVLRDRRLVKPRREKNVIYYAVDDAHLTAFFREAEYHADHVRRGLPDHPST